jgi:hypothetical protein
MPERRIPPVGQKELRRFRHHIFFDLKDFHFLQLIYQIRAPEEIERILVERVPDRDGEAEEGSHRVQNYFEQVVGSKRRFYQTKLPVVEELLSKSSPWYGRPSRGTLLVEVYPKLEGVRLQESEAVDRGVSHPSGFFLGS